MHKVGFIVYPGFQLVCLAASSVFEVADRVLDAQNYEVSIRSEAGGSIRGTAAVTVLSEPLGSESFDSAIVCGGAASPEASEELVAYLQRATATTPSAPVLSFSLRRDFWRTGGRPLIG
jgi:transcriptional regulator GlxA family with amidase domain